jgi:uncharacterized protein involved in exopolysaccharide biosynthesis
MNAPAKDNWRDGEVLDFNALIKKIWAGRWWVIASSVTLGVLALVTGFLMTPAYRATVVLIPASAEHASLGSSLGSLGGLAALAGFNLGGSNSTTQEALGLLQSRQFGYSFISDNQLVPQFFDDKWDSSAGKWKVPEDEQPTMAEAYRYFDRKVRGLIEDKKTGLITLQITWREREAAAKWANSIVERLNAEMQRRAIERSDASLGFLKKELDATAVVDTRNAINRLIENQVNQKMLATVTSEYAFRVVDRAVTPSKYDKVRPRKLLMALTGAFLGSLAAIVCVLVFHRSKQ